MTKDEIREKFISNHKGFFDKKPETPEQIEKRRKRFKRNWQSWKNTPKGIAYQLNRNNKRRIAYSNKISVEELKDIKIKQGNKCLRCGKTGISLTYDHIIPISKGGGHIASNLQMLCKPCNSSKGIKTIDYR